MWFQISSVPDGPDDAGPVSFEAAIQARTPEEAIGRLKSFLPPRIDLHRDVLHRSGEGIVISFNPAALTVKHIYSQHDEDGTPVYANSTEHAAYMEAVDLLIENLQGAIFTIDKPKTESERTAFVGEAPAPKPVTFRWDAYGNLIPANL